MKSLFEIVRFSLSKLNFNRSHIKYLVLLDENLPLVHLDGSLVLGARDFGRGISDKDLFLYLEEATKGFKRVLIISADHDFVSIRFNKKLNGDKISHAMDIIDLNLLCKRDLRRMGIKKPVAQSSRREKVRAIKKVYQEWLINQKEDI